MSKKDSEFEEIDLPKLDYEDYGLDDPQEDLDEEEIMMDELSASLGAQVNDELSLDGEGGETGKKPKKKRRFLVLKIFGGILGALILFALWVVFTPSGRRFGSRIAARFIHSSVNAEQENNDPENPGEAVTAAPTEEPTQAPVYTDKSAHRYEDYVTNYLVFGLEQINGGSRSDAMMLVSLNTKDNTIKLTSFLRDTYVTIPGHNRNKLNAAYGYGGPDLLVDVLENTYDIEIEGYASVNFNSLEAIVDRIGGIDLELGEAEARYLRNTNYISKPENRTVQTGWNHMNGNQVLGYCRVRKVSTLGGANNDYGRTVRHRRVIKAIIEQFKNVSYFDMLSVAKDCLGYLETNVTEDQIADALYKIVENKMFETESMRLPTEYYFRDSGKAGINGITYALVIDDYIDTNIELFHQFLFLDPTPTPEEGATPSPDTGEVP